ncbi:MAG: hypothetical protein AB8B67_02185 [Rickettsiaceae bacterium]
MSAYPKFVLISSAVSKLNAKDQDQQLSNDEKQASLSAAKFNEDSEE